MYKVFVNESLLTFSDSRSDFDHPQAQPVKPEDSEELIRALLAGTAPTGDYHIPLAAGEAFAFLTRRFEPVTAAGGIVLNGAEEILWIFRRGKWDLPKGKADEGETIEETALREVREECGIRRLTIERFLGHCYHIYPIQKGRKAAFKTTHWYLMRTPDTQLVPQAEEQITDIRFFEKGAAEPLQNTFRSLRDFLENYYA